MQSSNKFEEIWKRGDLLTFFEEMLLISNGQLEVELIINELAKLQGKFNLRFKKKKSKILTGLKIVEISKVKCTKMLNTSKKR